MPASTVGVLTSADAHFIDRQRAVWASLPLSLVEHAEQPELVAIDGAASSWPSDLLGAVEAGASGVVVVEPTVDVAAEEVRHAAERASFAVPIVVHREWAGHPAVANLVASTASVPQVASLVDCVVTLPEVAAWPSVLGAQLALLRALGVPMISLEFAACGTHGYTLHGRHAAGVLALAAWPSAGPAPFVRTTLYGADAEMHLDVWATADATPAQAWLVDATGSTMQPAWYESAARATWRRLRTAAQTAERPADLATLADDLDTVAQITQEW
jgi:hypothetical protein